MRKALLLGGFVAVSAMLKIWTRTPDPDALALRGEESMSRGQSTCADPGGAADDWTLWEVELGITT